MKRTLWIRLAVVGAMTLLFMAALVPWRQIATHHDFKWSYMLDVLRPGIDLAGGSRLVYQVDTKTWTGGGVESPAQSMIMALKKRVDPNGVMNLVWRPVGQDKIEITIPRARATSTEQEKAYRTARAALTGGDIKPKDIADARLKPTPAERREAFLALERGVPGRGPTLEELADASEKLLEAEMRPDQKEALLAARYAYRDAVAKVEKTNFNMADVEQLLRLEPKERMRRPKAPEGAQPLPTPMESLLAGYTPGERDRIKTLMAAYDDWKRSKQALDDPTDVKRLLKGTGVLEFHIAVQPGELAGGLPQEYIDVLRKSPDNPVCGGQDRYKWFESGEHRGGDVVSYEWGGKTYVLCWNTPDKSLVHRKVGDWKLKGARPTRDQMGGPAVAFEFDDIGGYDFGLLTGKNLEKLLAAILDGKIVSIATIRSAIHTNGEITGRFTLEEVNDLAQKLQAGALPGSLLGPISESQIGSLLGEAHAAAGLKACIVGLIVVVAFILTYYLAPLGLVAVVAIVFNLIYLLGAMALLPGATFTLPGIAGVVLTVAMAVDANVLIGERIREEQGRGATLRMAIKNGYSRAFSAILDSNATTLITTIILYFIGTAEIKGFALTLGIGLVCSMFTAVFLTRWLLQLAVEYGWLTGRFRMLPTIRPPTIRWMDKRYIFWGLSVAAIGFGLSAFFVHDPRDLYDTEFVGGTKLQATMRPGARIDDGMVYRLLKDDPVLPGLAVRTVSETGAAARSRVFEINTTSTATDAVKKAVIDALSRPPANLGLGADSLFRERAELDFAHADAWARADKDHPLTALPPNMFAITAPIMPQSPDRSLDDFVGGAGLVIDDVRPPVSIEEIRSLLRPKLGDLEYQGILSRFEVFGLEQAPGPEGDRFYNKFLLVAVSDRLTYAKEGSADNANWLRGFLTPLTETVTRALRSADPLDSVNNFDASVAGDVKVRALLAVLLSFLAMIVYVGVRFGNWLFGLGAVFPLFHDMAVAVGLVAVSKWLADTSVGQWLMIENFRFDTTVVAAVLTIIGYSINDKIVVFDRIRENRGRLGYVTVKIVDDSINQCMSRTLLTGLTVQAVLLIMYILGGPGIRAFNYVMLIGVIIGTYSSVVIAGPILLGWRRAMLGRAVKATGPAGGPATARPTAGKPAEPAPEPAPRPPSAR